MKKWFLNLWDKIKTFFKSVFNAFNTALFNSKLWFVKNIDFIKKCLLVFFVGLICLCVMPFACNSKINTAKADTLDNLTDSAIIYDIGSHYLTFPITTTGSSVVYLTYIIEFGLEFDYYTNSVYMLLPSNYRIDLTSANSDDGSSSIVLPSVFRGTVYGTEQSLSQMVLTISNTSLNVFEEDFINSPTWVVSFGYLGTSQFNINIENSITGGGVSFTAFLTYNNTIRDYSGNISRNYSFQPLIYLVGKDDFNLGYNEGYNTGYTEGAEVGYQNAINDGASQNFFSSIASMVSDFVSMEIFPGIPIAYIILIAFGFVALRIILNLFAT